MDQTTSEPLGNIPHDAELFRNVPHASEGFGSVPQIPETGQLAERRPTASRPDNIESYSMTVRAAARAFEDAGVARTERSITNWCQPNRQGVARLDCYYEPNEHRYYITPQSVDRAIKEELAKAREQGALPNPSELGKEEMKEPRPAPQRETEAMPEGTPGKLRELELENRDLLITSRAKDMFIEQLRKDREAFVAERQQLIDQLISSSRTIGELETKLLQIEAPREDRSERNPTGPNDYSAPASIVTHEPQVENLPSY